MGRQCRLSARQWANQQPSDDRPCGRPGVHKFNSVEHQEPLLAVCRVSTIRQEPHLIQQVQAVSEVVPLTQIAAWCCYTGKGYDQRHWYKLASTAHRYGAKGILWVSSDRALRSPEFHPYLRPEAQPTAEQWENLFDALLPYNLYTVLDPNLTLSDTSSYQATLGLVHKERREVLTPVAAALRAQGRNMVEISIMLDVPRETLRYWLGI